MDKKLKVLNKNKFDVGVKTSYGVPGINIKSNSFAMMSEEEIGYVASTSSLFSRGNSSNNIMDTYVVEKDTTDIKVGRYFDFSNVESHTLVDVGEDLVLNESTSNVREFNYPLFSSDAPGFTLVIDYEFTDQTSDATLLSCFDYDGSEGFRLRYSGGPNLQWGDKSISVGNTRYRNVLAIRREKGSNKLSWYTFNGNGTTLLNEGTSGVTVRSRETVTDAPIILGAFKYSDSGAFDNMAKGVIHYCRVWMEDLGDANARELVSWFYETWKMDYIGTGIYRWAETSSKYSNMSFICDRLMEYTRNMNPTSTNAGGWDECEMRKFLNPTYG